MPVTLVEDMQMIMLVVLFSERGQIAWMLIDKSM